MSLLELKDISKIYGELHALDHVSLTVEKGEWIAIMGPSGSGKSTMMNIISCMDKPTSGQVIFDGKDITRESRKKLTEFHRDKIGLVFQQFICGREIRRGTGAVTGPDISARRHVAHPKGGVLGGIVLQDNLVRMSHLDSLPYRPLFPFGKVQEIQVQLVALVATVGTVFRDRPTSAMPFSRKPPLVRLMELTGFPSLS